MQGRLGVYLRNKFSQAAALVFHGLVHQDRLMQIADSRLCSSCGRRVTGWDVPRCCKERTCLTRYAREGRKREKKKSFMWSRKKRTSRKKALTGILAATKGSATRTAGAVTRSSEGQVDE